MKKALAFDIGGTKIYSTIIDENGNIMAEIDKFHTPKTIEGIVSVLKEQIQKFEDSVDAIAISTAGGVNLENTAVLGSTGNLVAGYPTIDFQSLSKKNVFIENDANCAAWAEYKIGASKGSRVSVMLTLGTGVGGGIILNGKILTGSNGAAGEIGHLLVNPHETRTCGCGKKGCLEQYSSATGITRMSKEKLEETDTPSELRQYDHPITGLELFKAYKNNDALAKEIVDTFSSYLGKGLSHVAAVVDPQAFVIGGGVSKNGQIVLDVVQEKYEQDVMFALKGKEFRLAELGNDAGMYGAVRMILS